jgi:hypothetical protein
VRGFWRRRSRSGGDARTCRPRLCRARDLAQRGLASAIYHCAAPPYTRWPQEFPQLTRAIAQAALASGAALIFADNLYMYGPVDGLLKETTPVAPVGNRAFAQWGARRSLPQAG